MLFLYLLSICHDTHYFIIILPGKYSRTQISSTQTHFIIYNCCWFINYFYSLMGRWNLGHISYHIPLYPWILINVPYQQHSWTCIYLKLLVKNYEWRAKKNRKSLYFSRTDILRKFIWTSIWQQIPDSGDSERCEFNGETMFQLHEVHNANKVNEVVASPLLMKGKHS